MIRYEYRMERVSLRTAGREMEKLNSFGNKGFEAIHAVQHNTDLVVLLMKETDTAPKKAATKKSTSKKDQQEIRDKAPVTKDVKKAMAELSAEE